jgi:hypothetical protein
VAQRAVVRLAAGVVGERHVDIPKRGVPARICPRQRVPRLDGRPKQSSSPLPDSLCRRQSPKAVSARRRLDRGLTVLPPSPPTPSSRCKSMSWLFNCASAPSSVSANLLNNVAFNGIVHLYISSSMCRLDLLSTPSVYVI